MKQMTLTFDNGPTVETTPLVLSVLEARGILAHFCLVGSQLAAGNEQLDIARETMRAGHRLVNHSMTHEVPLGEQPTVEHAEQEVLRMDRLMDESFEDWGTKWFRPFGRGGLLGQHLLSEPAVDLFKALDYSVLLWNCVPRDWVDPENWPETALREIKDLDHTVIVLHDLDTGAMAALPKFLDDLPGLGFEFTLDVPDSCAPFRQGVGFSEGASARYVQPGRASS